MRRMSTAPRPEKHYTFINNNDNFRLQNGELDDSLLPPDDNVHFNERGYNRLVRNLGLEGKVTTNVRTYAAVTSPASKGRQPNPRDHTPRLPASRGSTATAPASRKTSGQRSRGPAPDHNLRPRNGPPRNDRSTDRRQQQRSDRKVDRVDRHTSRSKDNPDNWRRSQSKDNNVTRCFNCNETGHVTDVCRHGGPIKCFKCGGLGHKDKHCRKSV